MEFSETSTDRKFTVSVLLKLDSYIITTIVCSDILISFIMEVCVP